MGREYPTIFTLAKSQLYRFWSSVDIAEPNECWPWLKTGNRQGYGQFQVKGLTYKAARLAVSLTKGLHNLDLIVRHTCDNPPCCNPRHLIMGTYSDNQQDARARGQMRVGERHTSAKLNEAQVREIHRLYATDLYGAEDIAQIFGVKASTVNSIRCGRAWKHLRLPPIKRGPIRGVRVKNAKLTDEKALAVFRLFGTGEFTSAQVGERFGVSGDIVLGIANRRRWAHATKAEPDCPNRPTWTERRWITARKEGQ